MRIATIEASSRILQPARPRLDEARATVEGIEDARVAWEALARRGVIPDAWVNGGRRGFVSVGDAGLYVSSGGEPRPPVIDHPPTIRACVTMASDPEGVCRAESLAAACVAALAPWHPEEPGPIVWDLAVPRGFSRRPVHVPQGVSGCEAVARQAVETASWDLAQEHDAEVGEMARAILVEAERRTGHRLTGVHELILATEWWEMARRMGLVVPRPDPDEDLWVPKKLARRPFADLPDPFEPLWAIFLGGYALSHVGPDAIVLEASRVA